MTENREMLSSLIYRTNNMLKRDLQDHLKPYGITTDQWMVLRRVYLNSGKYNQKELADASFRERAAITRMIDLMEKKHLIERRNSPDDRREYLLYITDEGKKAYEETVDAVSDSQEAINKILPKEELKTLIVLMSKLERGMTGNSGK